MTKYSVVEICAGAGGQSLGLHKAGFEHSIAIEIDERAAATLADNLGVQVAIGDVADENVWKPADFKDVDLFAGGVPCPPFSVAGKQLGSSDERDLFAWAVEQVAVINPRAVMLENVRGLASSRFSAYRQRVLDRLSDLGYVAGWRLFHASDFGVPQARPRFVLIAVKAEYAPFFRWPEPDSTKRTTVGEALVDLMAERGWPHAQSWAESANEVGPTLVGGSKKHGGADLGPTRAKEAWKKLLIDGKGVADVAPSVEAPPADVVMPRITVEMAARIQGWKPEDKWVFNGRKTAQYRQIGNAFPPPVAEALGRAVADALGKKSVGEGTGLGADLHDPVYRLLADAGRPVTMQEILVAYQRNDEAEVQQRLSEIRRDFELDSRERDGVEVFELGAFRGFVGQATHHRHEYFEAHRNKVS